jgi:hypothetical protein
MEKENITHVLKGLSSTTKFVESTKSVSSYSYETVTEDGTSTTTIMGRPKYSKVIVMY